MKFYDKVGFAVTEEVDPVNHPGMWEDHIKEIYYVGELVRNMDSRWISTQQVNEDLHINNKISILADPFAERNFHAIKYIWFKGTRWKVVSVEVDRPRLILTTGGEYNGDGPTD